MNKDLASLSAKEAEYGRLKRALTTSSAAAAHYANRILEEEISSEVAKKEPAIEPAGRPESNYANRAGVSTDPASCRSGPDRRYSASASRSSSARIWQEGQ